MYSLDPKLSFEEIESFCFKSSLPIVTPHNMMEFNSPHNAPMWRKSLHDELGFFDASFNSAADWEFWLRCLLKGKQFFKLNRPHVAYYYNPEGLSTRPDVRTVEEIDRIAAVYRDRLISPRLSTSRAGFAESIGLADDVDGSPYELVQLQLRKLGDRCKATQRVAVPVRTIDKAALPMKVVVDGVIFQVAFAGIARVWRSILPRLANCADIDMTVLDRCGSPSIDGVEKIGFPSYTWSNTAADSLLLDQVCRDLGADVFLSTYYTSPVSVPSVLDDLRSHSGGLGF